MNWAKYLFLFVQSLALARLLRDKDIEEMVVIGWKERGRKKDSQC